MRETVGEQFLGDFAVSRRSDGDGFGGLPDRARRRAQRSCPTSAARPASAARRSTRQDGEPDGRAALSTVDPAHGRRRCSTSTFVAGGWDATSAPTAILVSEGHADARRPRDRRPDRRRRSSTARRSTLTVARHLRLRRSSATHRRPRRCSRARATQLFDFQVARRSRAGRRSIGDVEAAIKPVVDKYPTSEAADPDEFIDEQTEQVDAFLNFIYALLGMSIFIAILGIVITLLLRCTSGAASSA